MKTFASLIFALFVSFLSNAQLPSKTEQPQLSLPSNSAVSTPTLVSDTLHYFYNKEYFKRSSAPVHELPYYKFSAPTSTNISHLGSVFLNTDPYLTIYGLEGFLGTHPGSLSMNVPLCMYLYNVNANLLPTTIIDSVDVMVNASPGLLGTKFGGTFGNMANPLSHTVSGNFAVVIKNKSTSQGDTVRLFRTSSATATSAAASNTQIPKGEGLGVFRVNNVFYKTTNFAHPAFGVGSDYEFCLAPMVNYVLYAGHIAPPEVNSVPGQTIQCLQPLTFTNISTPHFTSRFFNLNVFYQHFSPFSNQPPNGFSNTNAVSWYFDDEDLDNPNLRPPINLRIDETTITKYYDTSGCFTNGSMRANLRKMQAAGSTVLYRGVISFSVCVGPCYVGIQENTGPIAVLLSENPVYSGKIKIKGPEGDYDYALYNGMGQLCFKKKNTGTETELDVSTLAKGCYVLKIETKKESSRVKIIKMILK